MTAEPPTSSDARTDQVAIEPNPDDIDPQARSLVVTGPIGFQGYGIKGDARSILAPTMQAWRKLSAAAAR